MSESAVELHGSLGPARTTMKAVAEHAGVPRSTVYRHFPDEEALLSPLGRGEPSARHYPVGANPRPRRAPSRRPRELYAYYHRAGGVIEKLLGDEAAVPIVAELFVPYHQFLETAAEILMRGTRLRGKTRIRVRAALGHVIAFTTLQELTDAQGLKDREAVSVRIDFEAAAAERSSPVRQPNLG